MTDVRGGEPRQLRVAMIGYAFMGAAHSQGWRNAHRFFDLPAAPRCGALRRTAAAAAAAAAKLGWADRRHRLARGRRPRRHRRRRHLHARRQPRRDRHRRARGRQARALREAARQHGRRGRGDDGGRGPGRGARRLSMVGLQLPPRTGAGAGPRGWSRTAGVGTLRHIRAVYVRTGSSTREFPLVWRLQKDQAGSGALGDIGAHIVDLAYFLTGERLTGVSGTLDTFVKQRPLPDRPARRAERAAAAPRRAR